MELMTIKQFAESQGITYEAVRRQVARYSEELSDHIIRKHRTQYLDEKAVEFLKERRRESPIVMQVVDQSEEIEELRSQIETLKAQLMSAQGELLKSQDERLKAQNRIIELQEEAKKTLEDRARYSALLEDNEAKTKKLQEAEGQLSEIQKARDDDLQALEEIRKQRDDDQRLIEDLQKERDDALRESKSYYRSWFGFYRKI